MAVQSVAGPLGELRGGTSKGLSLSTTAAFEVIPKGTQHLFLTARNFSTAVVARVLLNPYLIILRTQDALATAPTDYSAEAQDGSTSTSVTLSSQGTAAQSDFLYVGSHIPFSGVNIDVDSVNSNASVLTVKYWDGNSWEDISDTDGTDAAGASLGQDGSVTWTVPSTWAKTSLVASGDTTLSFPYSGNSYYWTRWEWSAALDAAVTLDHMLAINRSTAYFELIANQEFEVRVHQGPEGLASVQGLTDAGTGNLICNFATSYGTAFP